MRVGTANGGQGRPEPQEQNLTAEEAGRRITALRHVYDEGYISGAMLEALMRSTRARVKRNG